MPAALLFFSKTIKNENQLMKYLFLITLFQSLVILVCAMNVRIADTLDSVFNQNTYFNYSKMRSEGYPGGIWCITSTGTLQLSLGLISCVYFIINKKSTFFFLLSFAFFSFISIIVARTGVALAVVCLVAMLVSFVLDKRKKLLKSLLIALTIFIAAWLFLFMSPIKDSLPSLFRRLFELKEKGLYGGFFIGYYNGETTRIPAISFDTIIGTGIMSGISGQGIAINADGGFVRMYCAIGLPLCVVFYSFLILLILYLAKKCNLRTDKIIVFLFGLIFFIGEFKEPFFFKKYFWLFLFLFAMFVEKKRKLLSKEVWHNEIVRKYGFQI